MKDQSNFWQQNAPGGFSDLINQKNYDSNWKHLLGFRNIQEKLEKISLTKITILLAKQSCPIEQNIPGIILKYLIVPIELAFYLNIQACE